jgi:DNA polymerase-3 subunit delta
MFYILHGENELERSEQVTDFKHKVGDESVRDLNVTILDGRKTTLSELQHAAEAIPFLADKRLVVVEGLLARLASRKGKGDDGDDAAAVAAGAAAVGPSAASKDFLNGLLAYLPQLSDTTRLVLVETQALKDTHPIVKLALKQSSKSVIEFKQPQAGELPGWITTRAKKHGGVFDGKAALKLATLIGGDLRRLDQEIIKLITYVNAQRPVTEKDVTLLVADVSISSVFDLVDALGKREGKRAAHELHHLLDQGENPLGLLAMIVRQFRLLILVKELQARNLPSDAIAKEISVHPFVAKKIGEQARAFRDTAQLETIYRRLLDIDVEIKTGVTPDVLALDLLVAGLAG